MADSTACDNSINSNYNDNTNDTGTTIAAAVTYNNDTSNEQLNQVIFFKYSFIYL